MRPAVKVLLQHVALAHRTWLPLGVLPAAHLNDSRALLGVLVGAHFLVLRLHSQERGEQMGVLNSINKVLA